MKNKARIQITIDVEYQQVHDDSDRFIKDIVSNLESNVNQAVGSGLLSPPMGDEFDVTTWDVAVARIDPEKAKAQFSAERATSFGTTKAYFSSDGPALEIHFDTTSSPYQDVQDWSADINGALREAFHKYQAHLRGS